MISEVKVYYINNIKYFVKLYLTSKLLKIIKSFNLISSLF